MIGKRWSEQITLLFFFTSAFIIIEESLKTFGMHVLDWHRTQSRIDSVGMVYPWGTTLCSASIRNRNLINNYYHLTTGSLFLFNLHNVKWTEDNTVWIFDFSSNNWNIFSWLSVVQSFGSITGCNVGLNINSNAFLLTAIVMARALCSSLAQLLKAPIFDRHIAFFTAGNIS